MQNQSYLVALLLLVFTGFDNVAQADDSRTRLDFSLGSMQADVENQLGGVLIYRNVGIPLQVNSNHRQYQFSPDMVLSQLRLQTTRDRYQFALSISNKLSAKETVATDSVWPSQNYREYYSESYNKADFKQWDASFSKQLKNGRVGFGVKNREYTFYNHDGVESYTSVPGYLLEQNGSILDDNVQYLVPYLSVELRKPIKPTLSVELKGLYSPRVKADEVEKNYWYGYRATSSLEGSSLEISAAVLWQLVADTDLLFRFDYFSMDLDGNKKYEDYEWVRINQKQTVKQKHFMLGISLAL